MINNPAKTKPYFDKANTVKSLSDSMINHLEQIKEILIIKI